MNAMFYDMISKNKGGRTNMTYRSHIAILLVLLAGTRDGHEKHDDPRDADLEPHLEVDGANAGIQACAHEDVVDETSGHTNLVPCGDGDEVHEEGHTEANDHGDSHEVTEVVDDLGHAEDVVVVEAGGGDHGNVDAADGVALIHEGLVAEGGDGKAFLHETRDDPSESELEDHETEVDPPRIGVGACILEWE